MNVGSLFSGIGGIELGFEREGFRTSWFVEYEPYCQEVLKKNFPSVPIYGDITKLDFSKLKKVDILTGGFPCQDISVAGKKAGIRVGKRSSLWSYYKEAIRILRPRVALIENVPNLANLGLDLVLADLADLGYNAEWFCLSARELGALHKRQRLFTIAYSNDLRQSWEGNGTRNSQKGIQDGKRNLEDGTGRGRLGEPRLDKDITYDPVEPANTNGERFNEQGQVWRREGLQPLNQRQAAPEKSNGIRGEDYGRNISQVFITNNISQRVQRFREEQIQGKQGFSWCKDVRSVEELFQRTDIPKPLVRRNSHGLSRRLDNYTQKERTKAIGNAVVPQVAQFIARRIKEVMDMDTLTMKNPALKDGVSKQAQTSR